MRRRQTIPGQWLIVVDGAERELRKAVRRLPLGGGVLIVGQITPTQRRGLRSLAKLRRLTIVVEGPTTARRVHNLRELRGALLARAPMILLSPMFATGSHPDWQPLPSMRAAALARLGGRRLLALGGMDAKRYAKVARLGFLGWAGISAFRT